jgi:muramoyltetrapeptide carboxypeptidase
MFKRPFSLQKGQSIGLVAPAGKVPLPEIKQAIHIIESWGIQVKEGKHLFEQYYQFAGTDEQRIADFQQMLDDPQIAAVICARGGYGITRIIDRIDFSAFLQSPKWITGYSDITALHCHLQAREIESIHAIMPLTFRKKETSVSVESLRKVLFGEPVQYQTEPHLLNRAGTCTGPIIGGNLALLASVVGTLSDIDTTGKILFIEDINEYLYNIDRMMVQLKRAGKLDKLAGLIIGHFSDVKDNEIPFGKTAYEIIAESVQSYSYPVGYGFPVGHEPLNMAIPCGRTAELTVDREKTLLSFKNKFTI